MPSPESLPSKMRELVYDSAGLEDYRQWRANQGVKMNPVMGVETVFDKQRAEFVQPRPSRALQDCLESLGDPDITQAIEEGSYSWDAVVRARDAVLDRMDAARNAYSARGQSNPFRRMAREGASVATTLSHLLDMIPDEKGLSILKGGLAFIFKAIERRDDNREKIFRTFENVPILLSRAQEARQTFPAETKLVLEVRKYYETLLDEIPVLIDLLLHRHRQKLPARIFNHLPEQEAKNIDDSLHRVTVATRSLDTCIDAVTRKTLSATYQSVKENVRQTQAVRQTVHSTNFKLGHIEEQGNEVKLQLDNMQQSVVKTSQELSEVKDLIREQYNSVVETASPKIVQQIQTYVYYVVVENEYIRGIRDLPPPYSPSPHLLQPAFLLTTTRLLDALDVPPLGPTTDLQRILAQSKTMEVDALGRGRWLMVEDRFKRWLLPGRSDHLLVDGHCHPGLSRGRCSPLSVFCASLTVAVAPGAVSLAHFCGEHFSPDDPLAGPAGVLRNLITQLLQYPDLPEPRLDFVDPDWYARVCERDVPALGALLHALVRQVVPRGTAVYCMLDNVSELEGRFGGGKAEEGELERLVRGLVEIGEDARVQGTFKLLMTCEIRSTEAVGYVDGERHVALRAGNIHSRPMMLTAFSEDVLDTMDGEGGGGGGSYSDGGFDNDDPPSPDLGMGRPRSALR